MKHLFFKDLRQKCFSIKRFISESLADPLVVSNGVDIGTWMEEDYCNKGHYAIGYKIKVIICLFNDTEYYLKIYNAFVIFYVVLAHNAEQSI